MSETRTRHEAPTEELPDAAPQPEGADPLQESLDELARMADALVDGLAIVETEEIEEQAAEPQTEEVSTQVEVPVQVAQPEPLAEAPSEPVTREESVEAEAMRQASRREALKQTLDQLSELIDDPSPPVTSAEIQVEGDRGEDISECLDQVMAPQDETLEAEPAQGEIKDEENTPAEVEDTPKPNGPPVGPPDPTEETDVESAVARSVEVEGGAAAVETETVAKGVVADSLFETGTEAAREAETAVSTETGGKRSTALWWLLAVVVVIGGLAASYYVLRARSTAMPTTTSAEAPVPDPPVVYTKRPRQTTMPVDRFNPAIETPAPAETVETVDSTPVQPPTQPEPARAQAEPTGEPVEAPMVREGAPVPAPVVSQPAPETDASAPADAAAEAPVTGTMASRGKTTETDGSRPQAAGVGIAVAEILIPPEPQAPEPAVASESSPRPRAVTVEPVDDDPPEEVIAPTDTEPVVIDRIEPVFDERSMRKGEEQTVVLGVLVDPRGRVVRVVVDETSAAGSDAEFAAINAVLRWTYEPALEGGQPTRSWTKERFEFSRSD